MDYNISSQIQQTNSQTLQNIKFMYEVVIPAVDATKINDNVTSKDNSQSQILITLPDCILPTVPINKKQNDTESKNSI